MIMYPQSFLDTSPLVMVVGGYDDKRPALDPITNKCYQDDEGRCKIRPGLTNDVELLSLSSKQISGGKFKNLCTKFVRKVFGFAYALGVGPVLFALCRARCGELVHRQRHKGSLLRW